MVAVDAAVACPIEPPVEALQVVATLPGIAIQSVVPYLLHSCRKTSRFLPVQSHT